MIELVCTSCGRLYEGNRKIWRCCCGGLLDISFNAEFPIRKIRKRKPGLWRYREAIPLEDDRWIVSFEEGFTPLLKMNIDGCEVWIKQDHLFPSGSFKDRGASVMISHVKSLGINQIVEDSSGNAGASVAAYAARGGVSCIIFAPAAASPAKLSQIRNYGADLILVDGTREAVAAAAIECASERYYASHAWNPFFFHGTKTFAYEVCEQLGWKSPDSVVLPVGNGTILLGAYIGFCDLKKAEIIDKIPKMIVVQSETCAPVDRAFRGEPHVTGTTGSTSGTIAEGIHVADPIRLNSIAEVAKITSGSVILVQEDEIAAWVCKAAMMGFCIEPTSAATMAGVQKYIRSGSEKECIVSSLTGHGLKSPTRCTSRSWEMSR